MDSKIRKHTKNASLYDTQDAYLEAIQSRLGRRLADHEVDFLIKNAVDSHGNTGAWNVWTRDVTRVAGEFTVCDTCRNKLTQANDVVILLKSRIGSGNCDVCGMRRTLRKYSVDNYSHAAKFVVKKAKMYSRGDVVKIVDAPVRFNALIGEYGEVSYAYMTNRGVRYKILLENGMESQYDFSHSQLVPVEA